jgi:hypothetical protein
MLTRLRGPPLLPIRDHAFTLNPASSVAPNAMADQSMSPRPFAIADSIRSRSNEPIGSPINPMVCPLVFLSYRSLSEFNGRAH